MPESPLPEPPDAAAEAPAPLTGPLLPVNQAELASALAYGLRGVVRNRVTGEAGLALPGWVMASSGFHP